MSFVIKPTVVNESPISWNNLVEFATVWLESSEQERDMAPDIISQFFPSIKNLELLDDIDSGCCKPFNRFLEDNIDELINIPTLRTFLLKYATTPTIYQKLIDSCGIITLLETTDFIKNGGFNLLEYKESHTKKEYLEYFNHSQTTFKQLIIKLSLHWDTLIPMVLGSYCSESDQTVCHLLQLGYVPTNISTIQHTYRLNLIESIRFLEESGVIPDSQCIGYMVHNDYPDIEIITKIKRYQLTIPPNIVYQNIATNDHSELLCYLYQNTKVSLYDLKCISRCWSQPQAIQFLIDYDIKPNVNCLILAIQFGYGSPFHLLVKSCQTSEINRRKKLIYKTLHTYSGSQDIDLYGIIYELARRTLPISYSLSKLMKRHQDDYTNSKEVIDYCLTNLELNPRVRLVLASCNL